MCLGTISALNSEREGNLGVELDKFKRLQERIQDYEITQVSPPKKDA